MRHPHGPCRFWAGGARSVSASGGILRRPPRPAESVHEKSLVLGSSLPPGANLPPSSRNRRWAPPLLTIAAPRRRPPKGPSAAPRNSTASTNNTLYVTTTCACRWSRPAPIPTPSATWTQTGRSCGTRSMPARRRMSIAWRRHTVSNLLGSMPASRRTPSPTPQNARKPKAPCVSPRPPNAPTKRTPPATTPRPAGPIGRW